jgi:RNA polymerase sigma-70 factor (ECF subfamily)
LAGRVYFQETADETALIQRTLAGDAAAFESLVACYQRVAFTVALRMLGEYEDARDATQNAFVKVYEHLDSYDPKYRFFSWMYRILINECLNTRRGRRATEVVDPDRADESNAEDAVETEERRRDVRHALLALPVPYREVIVLRHFAAMSYGEMSVALGVPTKTVKSRLYTARHRLAEMLSAWAYPR